MPGRVPSVLALAERLTAHSTSSHVSGSCDSNDSNGNIHTSGGMFNDAHSHGSQHVLVETPLI